MGARLHLGESNDRRSVNIRSIMFDTLHNSRVRRGCEGLLGLCSEASHFINGRWTINQLLVE